MANSINNRSAYKRWVFTINNPIDSDHFWDNEAGIIQYMVLQEEQGENGTRHWQGYLVLKKAQRLSWLKNNVNGRAHWEKANGTDEECIAYCTKAETRVEGGLQVEIGERPQRKERQGRSEFVEAAMKELEALKSGYKRPREVDVAAMMAPGFTAAYKLLTADVLGPYRPDLKILTMVGPPGTGKSFAIQKHFPNHGKCIMGNNGIWFQNPCAEVVVFEEFCGQIQLQRMLQFLDVYPLALEVKGGMAPAMYNTVIITSNTPPDGWYKGAVDADANKKREDAIYALWDRIGYYNGARVPVRRTGKYLEAPNGATVDELRTMFDTHCEDLKVLQESKGLLSPIVEEHDTEVLDTQ